MGTHLVHNVSHNCEGIFHVYIPMYHIAGHSGNLRDCKELAMRTWYSSQCNCEMTIREFLNMFNTTYDSSLTESSLCTYPASVLCHILCIMDCGAIKLFPLTGNEMLVSYWYLMQHYPSLHFRMVLQTVCVCDLWIAEGLLLVWK